MCVTVLQVFSFQAFGAHYNVQEHNLRNKNRKAALDHPHHLCLGTEDFFAEFKEQLKNTV